MQLEGGLLMEQVGYIVFLRTQARGREGEKERKNDLLFQEKEKGGGRRSDCRLHLSHTAVAQPAAIASQSPRHTDTINYSALHYAPAAVISFFKKPFLFMSFYYLLFHCIALHCDIGLFSLGDTSSVVCRCFCFSE